MVLVSVTMAGEWGENQIKEVDFQILPCVLRKRRALALSALVLARGLPSTSIPQETETVFQWSMSPSSCRLMRELRTNEASDGWTRVGCTGKVGSSAFRMERCT
jgi:hypothetical protein